MPLDISDLAKAIDKLDEKHDTNAARINHLETEQTKYSAHLEHLRRDLDDVRSDTRAIRERIAPESKKAKTENGSGEKRPQGGFVLILSDRTTKLIIGLVSAAAASIATGIASLLAGG